MNESEFRELRADERQLLEHLLSPTFAGKEELIVQAAHSLARTIDNDGSLQFDVRTALRVPEVKRGVLTEGEFQDADGVAGHVLLHVVDGQMYELEFYKENGSSVSKIPRPCDVEVFAQGSSRQGSGE